MRLVREFYANMFQLFGSLICEEWDTARERARRFNSR
jgi:hypothetical protein